MDDVIVVGAGIVGIATARSLLLRRPDLKVTVVDKADEVGTAQTGHNSGVIHAGLYYAPGSLKARLCRLGEAATKEFCEDYGVPYKTIGKLVVATNTLEVERMRALEERADKNGISTTRVSHAELEEIEPNVIGVEALLSPATGVVDYREVARAMAADLVARGGRIITRAAVRSVTERTGPGGGVHVETDVGPIQARTLVACAGLQADRVASMGGLDVDFRIIPFRGEYYQLPQSRSDIVSRLIYPVPDPDLPFLGVHVSPTIDGRVTVGPNAVLGFSRDGYPKFSVSARDFASMATFPGLWKFAPGYLGVGMREMKDSVFVNGYLKHVHKYAPSITKDELLPYPAGIRAQAVTRSGQMVEDFLIKRTQRQLHVCNAPSPAATSAIPIGDTIAADVLLMLD